MYYPILTPWWLRAWYREAIWKMPEDGNKIYLSFDDGPHPSVTPAVLDMLASYGSKATFFCIGKNVAAHPDIYRSILDGGHGVGNHTMHHLNGWKTSVPDYLADIRSAGQLIQSDLFRPPYGRLTGGQRKAIREGPERMKLVMWTVLSGDFDKGISPEQCLANVLPHLKPGSIVLFHDSEKAKERVLFALPKTLEMIRDQGLEPAVIA